MTVVLLGAGASVDAGLPTATGMTKRIVDTLNDDAGASYQGTAQALNFAVGALIAHDTARGARPDAGVDVERLFAAVQMLADRTNLEVAPFVAAWAPALDSFGQPRFPPFFDRDFGRALLSEQAFALEHLFKEAVLSVVGAGSGQAFFGQLQDKMTMALRRLVDVDSSRVGYLAPLLSVTCRPLKVVTLNYDRAMEQLCTAADLVCDTGIEAWSRESELAWDGAADVHLLKLHGSIDWCVADKKDAQGRLPEPRVEVTADPTGDSRRPAVVFGQRGKLRADGPFLDMLRAFDDMLSLSRSLLVVGYSFRDDHVNNAISRWLNADASRTVTVVDPAFAAEPLSERKSFAATLRRALVPWTPPDVEPSPGRLTVVNATAATGLAGLLGPGPVLVPPATQHTPGL